MYKWTFMVYMAGDNGKVFEDGYRLMADLQQYGWQDIREMSQVGSSTDVAVIVQYDTLSEQEFTPRFFIDGQQPTGQLIEKIPSVNTGDPKSLTEFIVWAEQTYPAERYALVLWNHGTGWKEDDIYARYRTIMQDQQIRSIRGRKILRHALFLPTIEQIMRIEDDQIRAICFDDSSMDFLDNEHLALALRTAEQITGQKLSILGMDACLMSMIEVAYAVRHHADYMIGSQEVEQAYGWPYGLILDALVNKPNIGALELGHVIVEKFGEHYMSVGRNSGGINTQSAINLKSVANTNDAIKQLSYHLTTTYDSDVYIRDALNRAKHKAQTFKDMDFLDMVHFVELLRDNYRGKSSIDLLADQVLQSLLEGEHKTIVANFRGASRPNANGISIYFPTKGVSPFYEKQGFSKSGWNKVIRHVNQIPNM